MGRLEVIKTIPAQKAVRAPRIVEPAPTAGFAKFTEFQDATGADLSLDDALVRAGYLEHADETAFFTRYRGTVASRFSKIGLGKAFPPSIRHRLNAATHLQAIFVDQPEFHEALILAWGSYADATLKAARKSQRADILESFGFPSGFFEIHEPSGMPMTTIAVWGMVPDNKGLAYAKAMDWLAALGTLNPYKRRDARSFEIRPGINTVSLFQRSPTIAHTGRCLASFGIPLTHNEADRLIRKAGYVPGGFKDLIQHLTPEIILGIPNPNYPDLTGRNQTPERINGIVSGAPIVALASADEHHVPCFSLTSTYGVTLDAASLGGGGFPPHTRFIALSGAREIKTRSPYETRDVPGTTREGVLL